MVMETEVAEGVTTEQPAVEPTEQKAEVEEAEPTVAELRAALAAEKTARDKAEHDLSSARGQLKQRFDQSAEFMSLRKAQAATNAYLQALAKGQIAGDPAVTQKEWTAAEQQTAAAEEKTANEARLQGFTDQITDFASMQQRDMDAAGLEPDAPELAEAAQLWEEAKRKGNADLARRATNMVNEVCYGVRVAAFEKEQAEGKKKSGSLTTPGLKASGAGGSNYIQKLRSGDTLPSAEEIDRLTAKFVRV